MKQSILILIALGGLLLGGCSKSSNQSVRTGPPKTDTEFAREVFDLLAAGDQSVSELIDWEHLNMFGSDVGAIYKGFTDGGDARAGFTRGFIKSFSASLKQGNVSSAQAANWREQSRDATGTIVAADIARGKLLLITVARTDGQQKVSAINTK